MLHSWMSVKDKGHLSICLHASAVSGSKSFCFSVSNRKDHKRQLEPLLLDHQTVCAWQPLTATENHESIVELHKKNVFCKRALHKALFKQATICFSTSARKGLEVNASKSSALTLDHAHVPGSLSCDPTAKILCRFVSLISA